MAMEKWVNVVPKLVHVLDLHEFDTGDIYSQSDRNHIPL